MLDDDDMKIVSAITVKLNLGANKILDDIAHDVAVYLVKKRETEPGIVEDNAASIVRALRTIVADPEILTMAENALERGIKRHADELLNPKKEKPS